MGKPLVAYAIEYVKNERDVDFTALSSDSEEILSVARNYQDVYQIRRPSEYARDDTPIEKAISHCSRMMSLAKLNHEIIAWVQPNVVNIPQGLLDELTGMVRSGRYDSAVSVKECIYPYWTYKVKNGMLYYPWEKAEEGLLKKLIPFRRQDVEKFFRIDGGVQVVKRIPFMSMRGTGLHPYLGERIGFKPVEKYQNIEVDSEADLRLAEAVLKVDQKESKNDLCK